MTELLNATKAFNGGNGSYENSVRSLALDPCMSHCSDKRVYVRRLCRFTGCGFEWSGGLLNRRDATFLLKSFTPHSATVNHSASESGDVTRLTPNWIKKIRR
jgi:hypothetical protein